MLNEKAMFLHVDGRLRLKQTGKLLVYALITFLILAISEELRRRGGKSTPIRRLVTGVGTALIIVVSFPTRNMP